MVSDEVYPADLLRDIYLEISEKGSVSSFGTSHTISLWTWTGSLIISLYPIGGPLECWLLEEWFFVNFFSRFEKNFKYEFFLKCFRWTWCICYRVLFLLAVCWTVNRVGLSVFFNPDEHNLCCNWRDSRNEISLSVFIFWISFTFWKNGQWFEDAMWGWPQLEHFGSLLQSTSSWSSSPHLKHFTFPLDWPLSYPNFWHSVLDLEHMDCLSRCKGSCGWNLEQLEWWK